MEKPLFYIGTAYLWTLMLLALTGTGLAIGLLVAGLLSAGLLLVHFLRLRRQGEDTRTERMHCRRGLFFTATAGTVVLACTLFLLQTHFVYEPQLSLAGQRVKVTGYVTEVKGDSAAGAHRCVLKVTDLQPAAGTSTDKAHRRVKHLQFSSKYYVPHVNDVVSFTGTLFVLGEQDPDVQRYYKAKGLVLGAMTYDHPKGTALEELPKDQCPVHPAELLLRKGAKRILDFRNTLTGNISVWLPEEDAAILSGMLVGDKSHLTEEQKTMFQYAGILHLFAVSGFHTSLWSMLLYRWLLRAGAGRKSACLGAMAFLWFFVALTGFAGSAIRAAIMLTIFFWGRMTVESADSLNSLGFAALCLLLPNPFYGGDSGILLSFFATLGILTLYPRIMNPFREEVLQKRIPNYKVRKRVESPVAVLVVSLCAFLFTLPVTMLWFGSVSLVSPITNLLVSAVSSTAILCAGLGAVFGLVPGLNLLTPWLVMVAGFVVRYVNRVCEFLAGRSFAYVGVDSGAFQVGIAAAIFLLAAAYLLYGSLPRDKQVERGYIRHSSLLTAVLFLSSLAAETLMTILRSGN